MQMTLEGGNVLTLTPEEFIELMREMQELESSASPTEAVPDMVQATVEHQKPKAGDLIEITGDGRVFRMSPHYFPIGTVLVVRDIAAPSDRVYASRKQDTFGMMIHHSFYKVVTRNVVEPCPDVPELPHVFEEGDIVRVTMDHAANSCNKAGDIGVITSVWGKSAHVKVAARKDVTVGNYVGNGNLHPLGTFELVVAKKDRKDSAVQK